MNLRIPEQIIRNTEKIFHSSLRKQSTIVKPPSEVRQVLKLWDKAAEPVDPKTLDFPNLGFKHRAVPHWALTILSKDLGDKWVGPEKMAWDEKVIDIHNTNPYGVHGFEGTKCYRDAKGNVNLFRPDENWKRFNSTLSFTGVNTPLPKDLFIDGLKMVARENPDHVPPHKVGSGYMQIKFIDPTPFLGVDTSGDCLVSTMITPAGHYFPNGLEPVHMVLSDNLRALQGTGSNKVAGNYAPTILQKRNLLSRLNDQGIHDVRDLLYTSVETTNAPVLARNITEFRAGNLIAVYIENGIPTLVSPESDEVLPGITRNSLLELAMYKGWNVSRDKLTVQDLLEADEVMATGTAVVTTPVGKLTYRDDNGKFKTAVFNNNEVGSIAKELYDSLIDIQTGGPDPFGWRLPI
ncbi:hypothetical protein HOG98_01415 [bacterium]|jgi:branched-chain amino acid aminotransferase|nr:hypothetical protein [bacterium]